MPKEVFIPFLAEAEESMLSGQKIATTRTRRYGYPGAQFKVFGRDFVLTEVQRTYLDIVVRYRFLDEGFKSSHAFVERWNRLHPRIPYAQNPGRVVYLHLFTLKQETAYV